MKPQYFLTFLLISFTGILSAQAPDITWQKSLGGSGMDELFDLKTTIDGGYLLAGSSSSAVDGNKTVPNNGSVDFWLIKLNADGDTIWQKNIGGSGVEYLHSIEATSNGGFLLGGGSNSPVSGDKTEGSFGNMDYWVLEIDANGNVLWDKTIGGSLDDHLFSAKPTGDGGYILAGSSRSNITGLKTSPLYGNYDYWVLKLDANRNIVWQKSYGGDKVEDLYDIVETSNGDFVLGGYSYSDISGNKTAPNFFQNSNFSTSDYWIVKIDAVGDIIWQNSFGGEGEEYLYSFVNTSDNGFVMVGYTDSDTTGNKSDPLNGGSDYWVVKLDAAGNKEWDQSLGGDGQEEAFCIRQTWDDGYIIGGYSMSGVSGDKTSAIESYMDLWLVKLNANGHVQWDKSFSKNEEEWLWGIEETQDKGFILGAYSGETWEGGSNVESYGLVDVWVIRLEGCQRSEVNDVVTSCDQYTNPLGTVYDQSGEYDYTLTSSTGCDSIVFLELTINPSYDSEFSVNTCETFVWDDGTIYTQDTTINKIFQTTTGCDSSITVHVTILDASYTEIDAESCGPYQLPDGSTISESGTYTNQYINNSGCDSSIVFNITITDLDNAVESNGNTFTALESDASYQWINCDTNLPVEGATNQSFTATNSGNYAVQISRNDCSTQSECVNATVVSTNELTTNLILDYYPNPTNEKVYINATQAMTKIIVFNALGQQVQQLNIADTKHCTLDLTQQQVGFYFIKVWTDKEALDSFKVFKNN